MYYLITNLSIKNDIYLCVYIYYDNYVNIGLKPDQ
ncbi:hypothetical protein FAM21731_01327 [Lentilactobacillus parabuchneri]|uniref:Uncharacterized protein n=1 Tax=Lentilactobacillus parabuchneri TaxID=152331 RepID=A0A1X1FEK6_9LACO|nr:hypothetical protein FAM21731_01327 [Lentilactobacillus parabuchneri]ORN08364.1 hypothetical protein FAM23163_01172 [Lentilactobacillus parabuchneri]ORN29214.1 hypothetical protein FAM23169_01274 [Lentilactobacillus parabuchneri]